MSPEPVPPSPPPRARWRRLAASATSTILDLVFPPVCMSCHGLVESEQTAPGGAEAASHLRHLCPGCRRRIVIVGPPHCTTCGYPFFGAVAENTGCPHCETLQPEFGEGRTVALLQGPLRILVHALKYNHARHVLPDLTSLVQGNDHFRAFLCDAVLVPVPLHPRKQRERGFNQAELLAAIFAAHAPGARVAPVLRRVVFTQTQTRLDRASRQANLKNAFALAPRAPVEAAARYVLVDDVFTTGATLNACAAVLRRAGVTRVDVATLGHG